MSQKECSGFSLKPNRRFVSAFESWQGLVRRISGTSEDVMVEAEVFAQLMDRVRKGCPVVSSPITIRLFCLGEYPL